MDFAFKITTNGRNVLAACMAMEAPLKLTRVAVGSGRVAEDADLADVHELIHYEAEGSIGERRHENNRLYITAQYSNQVSPTAKTFLLNEFIVYSEHPKTGEQTDFIYATLGDYVQSVPPCSADFPAAVWNFPMTTVISDAISVTVSAPAGLVTYHDLIYLVDSLAAKSIALVIPNDGWEPDTSCKGFSLRRDIALDEVTSAMLPILTVLDAESAAACELAAVTETLNGALRVWAKSAPTNPIPASLALLGDVSRFCTTDNENGLFPLPTATGTTLGGVKVPAGSGLTIDSSGNLALDTADSQDVKQLFNGSNG